MLSQWATHLRAAESSGLGLVAYATKHGWRQLPWSVKGLDLVDTGGWATIGPSNTSRMQTAR